MTTYHRERDRVAAEIKRPDEALALERIVTAAREVHTASRALREHFGPNGRVRASTLALVRFAAAMQELKEARVAFDALIGAAPAE
jgi:hypothetical protein